MDRREFLHHSSRLALGAGFVSSSKTFASVTDQGGKFKREAAWYKKLDGKQVVCLLCPRKCKVADQETGWCGVRTNFQGVYYTQVYGRAVTIHSDPIEKKPLFHYLPSTDTLSLSTVGCNFECLFCQNWELSQFRPEQVPAPYGFVDPTKLVTGAKQLGAQSIAFTYGEPVVFYEYMLDTAKLSKRAGIPAVMITNGYIEPKPMEKLLEVLSAVKVDFKAYDQGFYKKWCRGELKPVLETMKLVRKKGVWLEMVHLTIPGLNDSYEQTKALCYWVRDSLGLDVPMHFTRFHPTYKLTNLPSTPPSTLKRQWEIAKKVGLHYVYVGNLPGHEAENTRCHHCGECVIRRIGFSVVENKIRAGNCGRCNRPIPGHWV